MFVVFKVKSDDNYMEYPMMFTLMFAAHNIDDAINEIMKRDPAADIEICSCKYKMECEMKNEGYFDGFCIAPLDVIDCNEPPVLK